MPARKWANQSHNHNVLLFQGTLNILGGAMIMLLWADKGDVPLFLTSAAAAAIGALACFLALTKPVLSDLFVSFLFFFNLLPVFSLLWAEQRISAALGKNWVPFQSHELSCLTIAILAPPVRTIGSLAIFSIFLTAVFQYSLFTPDQISLLPPRSLFAPSAFAAFALVLYFFRLKGLRTLLEIAEKNAELNMMKKFTRSILAIKDLANSPIQALTLDSELLRRKFPEAAELADRMGKSVSKLRDLIRLLDQHDRERAHENSQVSFDPQAELDTD